MKKVIIKADESLDELKEKYPERDYFTVKFKGKTYNDAWEDNTKHIWFGRNYYEYVPPYIPSLSGVVYMHDFVQKGNDTLVSAPKKSTARITIIR